MIQKTPSNPFLVLAKKRQLPYWVVLSAGDYMSPRFDEALQWLRLNTQEASWDLAMEISDLFFRQMVWRRGHIK